MAVVCACIYVAVALGFMVYSRVGGGPWVDAVDFGLDVLACALWPLGLCVLAFGCLVCAAERRRGRRL